MSTELETFLSNRLFGTCLHRKRSTAPPGIYEASIIESATSLIAPQNPRLRSHLKYHCFFPSKDQTYFLLKGALREGTVKLNAPKQHDFFSALCNWVINAGFLLSVTDSDLIQEMITCVDSHFTVQIRLSICREVKVMCMYTEIIMRDIMKEIPGIMSSTTDAYS